MPIRLFYILVCFFCIASSHAQNYNYQHYDLSNGLSGLTVYSMVQDKDGYIWFGTETGVSRFDGAHFKNFTTADGLPDNEVLKVYTDSKNRVWILPFTNSISYYKNGVIYSPKNDMLLAKLKFKSEPYSIQEDAKGNIIILERTQIHIIGSDGSVYIYDSFDNGYFSNINTGVNENGNVEVYTGIFPYKWGVLEIDKDLRLMSSFNQLSDNGKFLNSLMFLQKGELRVFRKLNNIIVQTRKNLIDSFVVPPAFVGFSFIDDSLFTLNCNNKALLYNIHKRQMIDTFSIGKTVNDCFKDNEGNYWFATTGYGVYRLTSFAFKNYSFFFENNFLPVYSIIRKGEELLVGTNYGLLWSIDINTRKEAKKNEFKITHGEGRVVSLLVNKNKIIAGIDGIHVLSPSIPQINLHKGLSVKNMLIYGDTILISTNMNVFKTNINDLTEADTIWKTRSTCAYKLKDNFYIGTINGLYSISSQKDIHYLGKETPLLSSRISAIVSLGDTLWVATYGNGVIAYYNKKIVTHITEENGLTSNMCRNLAITKDWLWIGTDKGLNKISLKDTSANIWNYTTNNGLNCDIINCIYSENDSVYVGTPYGLTFFDPLKVDNYSIALLNVDHVQSKNRFWTQRKNQLQLAAGDNRLSIEYSCVSFKSQGDINYYYKLTGADKGWHITKANKLDLVSLSPGNYKLELYAINAFGKKSNVVVIDFSLDKFFYQELWFTILLIIVVCLITWLFVANRIKKIRANGKEKLKTQKRLSELEQMAFRAQMNPHFIFNCLNSIQQYIFSKDVVDANRFITEFSSLIRQTLELSAKKSITLEEEKRYLLTYLKLEHTRFEENFDFNIYVSQQLILEEIYMPPLLLQPFVENSIRHGIRNLTAQRGNIEIEFLKENEYLVCILEDNGIGRSKAQKLKNSGVIQHQSKGMFLIQKRIENLNMESDKKISLVIEDAFPDEINKGTRVTLKIPF